MSLSEPRWWYGPDPLRMANWLAPLARLYGRTAERRYWRGTGYRSKLPVIAVGNLTAGGSGKTPLVMSIAKRLIEQGRKPAFLSRGYGGSVRGPEWVDANEMQAARRYGDEPMMLATLAPVMIAADRAAGARAIESGARPADVILMDDGLQNPGLSKTLAIAVVDGVRGIGNGAVIPAGPLRAPLDFQLGLIDAIVVNRADETHPPGAIHALLREHFPGPVLASHVSPAGDMTWLASARVLAFAGIAGPERFFRLLARLGAVVVEERTFPDHHPLSEREAFALHEAARLHDARIVTTEKDWARLTSDQGALGKLRHEARILRIEVVPDATDEARLDALLSGALATGGA